MSIRISILVEDLLADDQICHLSTEAGWEDFEENVVRKARNAHASYKLGQELEEVEENEFDSDWENDKNETEFESYKLGELNIN